MADTWYQQYPNLLNKPGHRVLAALNQSATLSVPATFRDGIDSGISQKSMWVGTCPVGINDSPTALRASCRAIPNAACDKSCDAYFSMHCGRHSPHSDRWDRRTISPTSPQCACRLDRKTFPLSRRIGSSTVRCRVD